MDPECVPTLKQKLQEQEIATRTLRQENGLPVEQIQQPIVPMEIRAALGPEVETTKAKEVVVGDYKGENITVGYNAAYLKDVLSHIGSDKITVQLKSPISAALFIPSVQEENQNLTMLLMPIRLNE